MQLTKIKLRSQALLPSLSGFMGIESLAKALRSPELQDFALMGINGRYTLDHLLIQSWANYMVNGYIIQQIFGIPTQDYYSLWQILYNSPKPKPRMHFKELKS